MSYTRIGIAITGERHGRRNEYRIYRSEGGSLYTRYEGYQEGDFKVGLPFAGPNAVHMQPYVPFVKRHFETVRFFEENPLLSTPLKWAIGLAAGVGALVVLRSWAQSLKFGGLTSPAGTAPATTPVTPPPMITQPATITTLVPGSTYEVAGVVDPALTRQAMESLFTSLATPFWKNARVLWFRGEDPSTWPAEFPKPNDISNMAVFIGQFIGPAGTTTSDQVVLIPATLQTPGPALPFGI